MNMVQVTHGGQPFPSSQASIAWLKWLATVVLFATSSGCWQEVRYEPTASNSQPPTDVAQDRAPITVEKPPSPQQVQTVAEQKVAEQTEPQIDQPASGLSDSSLSDSELSTPGPAAILPSTDEFPVTTEKPPVSDVLDLAEERLSAEASQLAAWQMSSEWSMAAALQAKDKEADVYGTHIEKAREAAKQLGVLLPELPTHEFGTQRLPKNLNYLIEEAGPLLTSEVKQQHGDRQAALTELATKTHVLLLSYTPSSTRLEPVIAAISQAAQDSGLPRSIWGELVELLASRSDFKQVKAAIFKLHRRAKVHLSEQLPL